MKQISFFFLALGLIISSPVKAQGLTGCCGFTEAQMKKMALVDREKQILKKFKESWKSSFGAEAPSFNNISELASAIIIANATEIIDLKAGDPTCEQALQPGFAFGEKMQKIMSDNSLAEDIYLFTQNPDAAKYLNTNVLKLDYKQPRDNTYVAPPKRKDFLKDGKGKIPSPEDVTFKEANHLIEFYRKLNKAKVDEMEK